jgi:hypothetical protein
LPHEKRKTRIIPEKQVTQILSKEGNRLAFVDQNHQLYLILKNKRTSMCRPDRREGSPDPQCRRLSKR